MQVPIQNQLSDIAEGFAIRAMSAEDIQIVAHLLADVFADNPAYRQIFEENDVTVGLRWLFERSLRLNQRYGRVNVICLVDAPEKIVGTFSLLPPDADEPSLIDFIRLGVLAMPFRFGLAALVRMISLMKENDRKIATAMKGGTWWYLGMVAISEPYRNRHLASTALRQAFAELGRPKQVALSTQRESNVRLYSRIGFRVLAENYMGYKQKTIRNWVMCLKD